jgi:RNA polymerase sigma-70 factor (ECF subfamily)
MAGGMRLETVSDEELVERVRGGETVVYELLMRRYNKRLFRIARSVLRNPGEAEDVVQEAFVRAYAHLDQFLGTAKFSTWLTKIALYESLARLRQRNRISDDGGGEEFEKPNLMENLESSMPGPEEQLIEKQAVEILENAVDGLPDNLRSVFMMREIEEMSTAETAECLGLTEAATKIRLHRARRLLRVELYARVGAVSSQAFRFLGVRCDRIVNNVMKRITPPRVH